MKKLKSLLTAGLITTALSVSAMAESGGIIGFDSGGIIGFDSGGIIGFVSGGIIGFVSGGIIG